MVPVPVSARSGEKRNFCFLFSFSFFLISLLLFFFSGVIFADRIGFKFKQDINSFPSIRGEGIWMFNPRYPSQISPNLQQTF